MSAGHDHSAGANECTMWMAFGLTGSFMVAEAVGGWLTGSLALISDAAHMLTDTVALGIALFAIRMGRKAADRRRTFGYGRFEILAAAFNAGMLFMVAIYIFYEAWQRFVRPPEIQSLPMLVIAVLGLIVNFASMRLLISGKDESLNLKGAYLEVWSDMLGSLGVIIGAGIIYFTGWAWFDPLIAVAIALWVLPRTYILLRESTNVLLEGVPKGMDLQKVKSALAENAQVLDVHDLHVWEIGSGKLSLAAHVMLRPGAAVDEFLKNAKERLEKAFGIHHCTIQCEYQPCSSEGCSFESPAHHHEDGHEHHQEERT